LSAFSIFLEKQKQHITLSPICFRVQSLGVDN
jgi:hypothetical protein